MSALSSELSKFFITPGAHELPPRIRVLTTTRVLPGATGENFGASEGIARQLSGWPPTSHLQGTALESTFAQYGHALSLVLPTPPLWLQQVHGNGVAMVDRDTDAAAVRQTPPTADAAVTRVPNAVLAILTADCLPVVIAHENASALAAAHAGWRSLAGGILENTVRHLVAVSSSSAASLTAWLGPAIGPTAFEVGEDVYAAFDTMNDDEAATRFVPTGVPGKWYADLAALARLRLRRLGISKISGGTWCTYSDAQRFFSYRRQRDEGRMATLAWIQGSEVRGQKSDISFEP
ncbi:MAG: peptidoglycan editing factor PgeF [Proteobacteria bacterium]|nr:peptidoglycan editing factor PgeF [Pseudomonadota bacterium]